MRLSARYFLLFAFLSAASGTAHAAGEAPAGCVKDTYRGADLVVCRFDPSQSDMRFFLNDENGEPLSHFDRVNERLAQNGERLVFAMNAGMYHETRAPVGLYVEDGATLSPLNDNDGPGNFHMKPNGVFWIGTDGARAQVMSAKEYKTDVKPEEVRYATQSGPMLVIDGEIHPRFLRDSDSFRRRNGVGVTESGEVIFALADTPVRFYDFATYFRDELKTPNALYLDGAISRLYAPELRRNDPGAAMGPMIGVVAAADVDEGT